ncbi:protein-serine O-palmitoleoyltransferase por [Rhodnius prolixus]|uniref:protein-serine O-palmitoleoyltransferase por n=1 Tax=Rhodnius prolixus TaxID=13249 RepID=UPI003D188A24
MYDTMMPEGDSYDLLEEDDYETENHGDYVKTQTFWEILRYCIRPTVLDAYANLLHLFLVCLIFRTVTQLVRVPSPFCHIVSSVCGFYIMFVFFHFSAFHTYGLVFASYFIMHFTVRTLGRCRGYTVSVIIFSYLILCEFSLVPTETWERIRGPQMMTAMKIISFAFDLDNGLIKRPDVYQYLGYCLCPSSNIFGPWISYNDYICAYDNDRWDYKWLKRIFISFVKSVLWFILSVCFLEWLIPNTSSLPWLVYRDAMLFRVGHYFVSYVSETSALFGGFTKGVEVTRPLNIELPHSLVEVVVCWNLPMHRWLKTYVFRKTQAAGTFLAVMSTYVVSALLHGLNLRLEAVLLSLGIYTYVEHSLRSDLSEMFNACVSSKPCPTPCYKHKRTTNNLIVHSTNIMFTVLAMFHLAYLGVLIDITDSKPVTLENAFEVWHNVDYVSHIVVAFTYLIHRIIRLFK